METKGKHFIVVNLTSNPQVIVPARRSMAGMDLIVPAFDYAEIQDNVEEWQTDRNLAGAAEQGLVSIAWVDQRPKNVPPAPPSSISANAGLMGMVREIVFGSDELARDFISAEPRSMMRVGAPLDKDWLKNTGLPMLTLAHDWLVAWGPPADRAWRVEAIKQRSEFIRMLP